ncbi:hypothetical protein [Duganella violaceipulchra]|uniref:Uncharacterized protein n=1 Tax=Duganella violaceipulchra TaxID=2849652 RepID=A0AA41H9A2_9BURK|nr:hypothetical protein [Duganella violaceicalia]MBV6321905.1 hypothetical protein [Duganella violaceicalia]MCP2007101.1 hypothetical protein [Duganella violaceicalia]
MAIEETYNEELERFIASKGGRFEPADWMPAGHVAAISQSIPIFRNSCETMRRHFYLDGQRPLVLEVISNENSNATCYATKAGPSETDLIGIYSGSIITAFSWFVALYASPDSLDVGSIPDLPGENWKSIQIDPRYVSADGLTCSDILRYFCAHQMAIASMEFLIRHEFAHVKNGHLELVNTFRQTQMIEMINTEEAPDWLYRQALEMDADCNAVLIQLQWGLSRLAEYQDAELPILNANASVADLNTYFRSLAQHCLYGTVQAVVSSTVIAGYTFFRMLNPSPWDGEIAIGKTHPPLPIRMSWVLVMMQTLAMEGNHPPLTIDDVLPLAIEVVANVEQKFGEVLDSKADVTAILSTLEQQQRALEYDRILKAAWAEIRPFLNKHKRGKGKLAGGDD